MKLWSLSAILMTASAPAFAAGYGGAFLGLSSVNQARGVRPDLAAHGGYQFSPDFSLGGYLSFQELGPDPGNGDPKAGGVNEIIYALEANYFFIPEYSLYVGFKLGLGVSTARLQNDAIVGGPTEALAGGPSLGFIMPIGYGLSVGEEISFLVVNGASPLNLFNALIRVDYEF